MAENFNEIALSRVVKAIEANLCFSIFGENSKWPPFLGRRNFLIAEIPCGSKILTKSLYLAQLRRQKQICVFAILAKMRKFKMAATFEESKIFGNCKEYYDHIPCGSKILTKSLYLARLRTQKQICVFPFLAKIRKYKMATFLGRGNFF